MRFTFVYSFCMLISMVYSQVIEYNSVSQQLVVQSFSESLISQSLISGNIALQHFALEPLILEPLMTEPVSQSLIIESSVSEPESQSLIDAILGKPISKIASHLIVTPVLKTLDFYSTNKIENSRWLSTNYYPVDVFNLDGVKAREILMVENVPRFSYIVRTDSTMQDQKEIVVSVKYWDEIKGERVRDYYGDTFDLLKSTECQFRYREDGKFVENTIPHYDVPTNKVRIN